MYTFKKYKIARCVIKYNRFDVFNRDKYYIIFDDNDTYDSECFVFYNPISGYFSNKKKNGYYPVIASSCRMYKLDTTKRIFSSDLNHITKNNLHEIYLVCLNGEPVRSLFVITKLRYSTTEVIKNSYPIVNETKVKLSDVSVKSELEQETVENEIYDKLKLQKYSYDELHNKYLKKIQEIKKNKEIIAILQEDLKNKYIFIDNNELKNRLKGSLGKRVHNLLDDEDFDLLLTNIKNILNINSDQLKNKLSLVNKNINLTKQKEIKPMSAIAVVDKSGVFKELMNTGIYTSLDVEQPKNYVNCHLYLVDTTYDVIKSLNSDDYVMAKKLNAYVVCKYADVNDNSIIGKIYSSTKNDEFNETPKNILNDFINYFGNNKLLKVYNDDLIIFSYEFIENQKQENTYKVVYKLYNDKLPIKPIHYLSLNNGYETLNGIYKKKIYQYYMLGFIYYVDTKCKLSSGDSVINLKTKDISEYNDDMIDINYGKIIASTAPSKDRVFITMPKISEITIKCNKKIIL